MSKFQLPMTSILNQSIVSVIQGNLIRFIAKKHVFIHLFYLIVHLFFMRAKLTYNGPLNLLANHYTT